MAKKPGRPKTAKKATSGRTHKIQKAAKPDKPLEPNYRRLPQNQMTIKV